jgi:hypothetical protein
MAGTSPAMTRWLTWRSAVTIAYTRWLGNRLDRDAAYYCPLMKPAIFQLAPSLA